ncbi:MAG: hypothetical protein AAFR87_01195 [Bacteroidota bacterium]
MVHTVLENSFGRKGLLGLYVFVGSVAALLSIYLYGVFIGDLPPSPWINLVFLFMILLLFFKEGVRVNTQRENYQYYLQLFSWKWGIWKSYEAYSDVLVLRSKELESKFHRKRKGRLIKTDAVYEVYLANKSHFDLIMIKQCFDRSEAEHYAHEFGKMTQRAWVQYNPGRRKAQRILGGYSSF